MRIITRKSEIKELLGNCLKEYQISGLNKCVEMLNTLILSQKVKFPLLEYCGEQFFLYLPYSEQIQFCDKVQELKTEGGNVILGIILQKRLEKNFDSSIKKAIEYVSKADIWYVCDIIGERVFGYSLLHNTYKTIQEVKRLSNHQNYWVVRSLGAGAHYAIKKGLAKKDVSSVFEILLSIANAKNKEVRQGVGWAAKTTAKFHPDIIESYQNSIKDEEKVANWFRSKISIGLSRNKYAKRNSS